jgi:hypothetical protein
MRGRNPNAPASGPIAERHGRAGLATRTASALPSGNLRMARTIVDRLVELFSEAPKASTQASQLVCLIWDRVRYSGIQCDSYSYRPSAAVVQQGDNAGSNWVRTDASRL